MHRMGTDHQRMACGDCCKGRCCCFPCCGSYRFCSAKCCYYFQAFILILALVICIGSFVPDFDTLTYYKVWSTSCRQKFWRSDPDICATAAPKPLPTTPALATEPPKTEPPKKTKPPKETEAPKTTPLPTTVAETTIVATTEAPATTEPAKTTKKKRDADGWHALAKSGGSSSGASSGGSSGGSSAGSGGSGSACAVDTACAGMVFGTPDDFRIMLIFSLGWRCFIVIGNFMFWLCVLQSARTWRRNLDGEEGIPLTSGTGRTYGAAKGRSTPKLKSRRGANCCLCITYFVAIFFNLMMLCYLALAAVVWVQTQWSSKVNDETNVLFNVAKASSVFSICASGVILLMCCAGLCFTFCMIRAVNPGPDD